jgi:glycerol-3-phosphate acyltransferase PlsY
MQMISGIVLLIASYLWGSLSPAYIVVRLKKGIDLREYGTGTVGGSNVRKQLGIAWMFGVGALDVLKGMVPPIVMQNLGFDLAFVILASLATILGHNWSLFLGFKGGRGVGTTVGVLFVWDVWLAIVFLIALAIGWVIQQGAPATAIGLILLTPMAWRLNDAPAIVWGCAGLAIIIFAKRLEANRLPLPRDEKEKRAVLWRRLWLDRDIPSDEAWQDRGRIR